MGAGKTARPSSNTCTHTVNSKRFLLVFESKRSDASRLRVLGAVSLKLVGAKLDVKLVCLVLRKELLN